MSDPDMIKEILMNTGGSFEKIPFNPQSKVLFGGGLVGLDGDKWALHRRITNQAFNMERVKVSSSILVLGSLYMFASIYYTFGPNTLGSLLGLLGPHRDEYKKTTNQENQKKKLNYKKN
jgi:hypothetical protein